MLILPMLRTASCPQRNAPAFFCNILSFPKKERMQALLNKFLEKSKNGMSGKKEFKHANLSELFNYCAKPFNSLQQIILHFTKTYLHPIALVPTILKTCYLIPFH